MEKSKDERLIEKATSEISQDSETAFAMLCLLIASPEKFKDHCEWSICLGQLFILVTDGILKKSAELRYDEVGEIVADEEIRHLLTKFSIAEKNAIALFLKGASRPLTLDKIEAIAGKI